MSPTLAVYALLFASTAGAVPATLTGTVRTIAGVAVPQVPIVVEGDGPSRTVLSGAEGRYVVTALSPGRYRVRVDAPGFRVTTPAEVVVGAEDVRSDSTSRASFSRPKAAWFSS